MPMIVDPGAPQVTPPATVTSPEGWLTAVIDEKWAGVVLSYNGNPAPAARNLVLNPSAEIDLTATAAYGSSLTRTRDTTQAYRGVASVRMHHTGTTIAGGAWSIQPVGAGATVHIGIWIKLPTSGAGFGRANIAWRNGTTTLRAQWFTPPTTGTWTRITGSYTVAAGQTCDSIAISCEPAGAGAADWFADAAMASIGTTLPDYVDGDQPGCAWEGTPHASTSIRVTALPRAVDVRRVLIVRQDPGAAGPVPVRSGDAAWAVEGVGQAYDHEAPLGRAVAYTARPQYADGTWGPATSLAVVVPAPPAAQSQDLWVKSLEEPGLSMRVMYGPAQGTTSAARQDTSARTGTPYTAVAYDTAAAPAESVSVDVLAEDIEKFRQLIRSGVLLAQVRPGYLIPDRYFVPGDVSEKPTGKLGATGGYTVTFDITPVERPDTNGQPMYAPGWSYDRLADTFATYDAVTASYGSYAALATNGAVA